MARSPIMAVIMGIIPFVNIYLLYKWWVELKDISKADYNPIVRLILCFIPLVNLYFYWKFLTEVEELAKKKGSAGYPLGATGFYVAVILFCWVLFIPPLYLIYKTQELLNAAE